jgi:hypothetical protein
MGKPSPQLLKFMDTYKVDADEMWEVQGTWCIKHAALERIAAEQNITFEPPQIATRIFDTEGIALLVIGRLGDRMEWSFGEASPSNLERRVSRNGKALPIYPWAFAEKRAKDRVILKLLNTAGGLYSESEADEFAAGRPNPHVTRPDDLVPTVEYDENGHPVDNIPLGDDRITQMPKAKAKNEYAAMQSELLATKTPADLERWGAANKNRVATLPRDWQDIMRGQYTDHMADLRSKQKEVA